MRENKVRSIWASGGAVINGWLAIGHPFAAEVMAHQGWDSLTIDTQHGIVDYRDSVPMLQAISTTDTTPLVRVPWNSPDLIMKALDAGSYGIICPMVNSRAEAEAFVGACRYPPAGYRSFGPARATLYAGADYGARANETVIAMAMIETAEAVNNLDEILSVPGLDAVYIGPADLSLSLGYYKERVDVTEPAVMEAIDTIVAKARNHGVAAGIHTAKTEYAQQMIEKGFQFITLLSDSRLMAMATEQILAAMKNRQPQKAAGTGPY